MSKNIPDSITINDTVYVLANGAIPAPEVDGMPYVVVRSATASPFAGFLESRESTTVVLVQARRIRRWYGALDLSQLATEGTKAPEKCQFGQPTLRVEIPWSEIHTCTIMGAASIQA